MKNNELIKYAIDALNNSYAPYSNYCVGAALLCENENVYTGCNIENTSFSATNCAERTAFFKAISEGDKHFSKIAIVAKNTNGQYEYATPCGVCRQVMSEFCDDNFVVIVAKNEEEYKEFTLSQLLPQSFSMKT